MAIFKAIASAALLAMASPAGWADAFAPASVGRIQHQSYHYNTEGSLYSTEAATPCEAPEDVDVVELKDASSLRNAMVTNVKGELVKLGDAMTSEVLSEKTYDTSVVVFLRHMG